MILKLYTAGVVKNAAVGKSCSRCRMRGIVGVGGGNLFDVSSGVADCGFSRLGRGEALRLAVLATLEGLPA